jgi:hypothetical protein
MAITDDQLDELKEFATKLGEDHVLNDPSDQDIISAVFDMAELDDMRTEDEFNAIVTPDDLPDPIDHADIVAAWMMGEMPRVMMVFDAQLWGGRDVGDNSQFWKRAKILRMYAGSYNPTLRKYDILAHVEFEHDRRQSRGHFVEMMKPLAHDLNAAD